MRHDALQPVGIIMAAAAMLSLAKTPTDYVVLSFLALLCLASLVIPLKLSFSMRAFFIGGLLGFIPVLAYYFFTRFTPETFIFVRLFNLTGLYLSLLIVIFAFRKSEPRDSSMLLLLILLLLVVSGYQASPLYKFAIVALTPLIAYYCIEKEHLLAAPLVKRGTRYWAVLAAISVVILAIAWGTARFFLWSESKVNSLVFLTMPSLSFSPAFADKTHLSAVTNLKGSHRVVIRVFSSTPPTYLVGKVFQKFVNNTWESDRNRTLIYPLGEPEAQQIRRHFPDKEGSVYHAAEKGDRETHLAAVTHFMSLYLTSTSTDTFFAPRGSLFALIEGEPISRDDPGVVHGDMKAARGEYHLALRPTFTAPAPLTEKEVALYTALPDTIAPAVIEFNKAHVNPDDKPWTIAQTYMDMFHNEYRYGAGPRYPGGKNILEEFLIEKREGHCEFFATGLTVLLRLNGIPARYINGFLGEEYNRMGGFYLIREKDAHAWVEAWFPGRGWTTLDPTPPSNVQGSPFSPVKDFLKELWETLALKYDMMRARLSVGDIKGFFKALFLQVRDALIWTFSSKRRAIVFIAVIAAFYLSTKGRKGFLTVLRKGKKPHSSQVSPEAKLLEELIARLEKSLAKRKIVREGSVPLLEFSRRLEPKAKSGRPLSDEEKASVRAFLSEYCTIRFGREHINPGDIEALSGRLGDLLTTLR
ncbi:MAG: transglutaminase family protein [Candidatus Eremiobacteraeota bacterium]|nr:transglutaminase family protein [Candidatus Eremiobacteraeota bacterium]